MAQPTLNETEIFPAATVAAIEKNKPKTVKMELKRHYVPHELISIVGHQRPERKVKNAAGEMVVATESKFIEGEKFPPVYPGVGFDNKIWAGTVIEVPEEEARMMRQKGIAEAYI